MANSDETTISLLVELIQQFFSHEISNNSTLSEAAKESLQVATECIEQAYSISRKPGSNELLEIYKSHQNRPAHSFGGAAGANFDLGALANAFAGSNPAQLLQNLASTFLSQNQNSPAGSESTTASSTTATAPPPPQQEPSSASTTTSTTTTRTPKVRKQATEAEKIAAESFKNQGNDLMKQDKFKEAYDCYSQAIDIDNNNVIYYSNRAAASSKLGNLQATIDDCQEAIEIDPTYSKAYSRLGYAYASMGNCQKAKEAYLKAVELDPENESHRNNLRAAEEQLQEQSRASTGSSSNLGASADSAGSGAGAGGPFGGGGSNPMADMLRSVMGNPEVMSMAMRSLQDPRLQSMFGLGGQSGGGGGGGGANPPRQ